MFDWIKDKFGGLITLTKLPQAVKAGREFIELLKAGKIDDAENKAIEVLTLFLPDTFTGTLDKFLDALYATVLSGIELYNVIRLMFGKTQNGGGDPGILVMAANPVSLASGVGDCLATLESESGKTSAPQGEKTENPLIVFAVVGLVIQLADFIIKRRRERKQDGK